MQPSPLIPKHSHHPKGSPHLPAVTPTAPPQPLATTHLLSVSMDLPLLETSREIIQPRVFCDYLSLNAMFSRFVHVIARRCFIPFHGGKLFYHMDVLFATHQPIAAWVASTFWQLSSADVKPDARVPVWTRCSPLLDGRSGRAVVRGPWFPDHKSFETGHSGSVLGYFWLLGYPESCCLFVWLIMELSTHTS